MYSGVDVGVKSEDQLIPAVLYADDMVMFAEDEEMLRRALGELGELCAEWSVKLNVEGRLFRMWQSTGEQALEHVESRVMVDSRAKAGARALCAWLKRYRISVGEMIGESFVRLLEALIELVLLYGAEGWGRCRQIGPFEQVQMRTTRISWGLGRNTQEWFCNVRR